MSVYVGIYLHRKRSQVAIVDSHGRERVNRNMRNDLRPPGREQSVDREKGLWTCPGRAWLTEPPLPVTARLIVDDPPGTDRSLAARNRAVAREPNRIPGV